MCTQYQSDHQHNANPPETFKVHITHSKLTSDLPGNKHGESGLRIPILLPGFPHTSGSHT